MRQPSLPLLAFVGILLGAPARAQLADGYLQSLVGTVWRGCSGSLAVRWHNLPVRGRYQDLTAQQRKIFHDSYEGILPGDEPPYPIYGMERIVKNIWRGALTVPKSGKAQVSVTVGPDGKARSISYVPPGDEVIAANIGAALMHETYKPAQCSGAPCTMSFPLQVEVDSPCRE